MTQHPNSGGTGCCVPVVEHLPAMPPDLAGTLQAIQREGHWHLHLKDFFQVTQPVSEASTNYLPPYCILELRGMG